MSGQVLLMPDHFCIVSDHAKLKLVLTNIMSVQQHIVIICPVHVIETRANLAKVTHYKVNNNILSSMTFRLSNSYVHTVGVQKKCPYYFISTQ